MIISTIPQRWIRPAVASASGFVMGLMLMGWLQDTNGADMPSYGGGYAYVVTSTDAGASSSLGALSACQQYVSQRGYQAVGYTSGPDFLSGCRAAYNRKK